MARSKKSKQTTPCMKCGTRRGWTADGCDLPERKDGMCAKCRRGIMAKFLRELKEIEAADAHPVARLTEKELAAACEEQREVRASRVAEEATGGDDDEEPVGTLAEIAAMGVAAWESVAALASTPVADLTRRRDAAVELYATTTANERRARNRTRRRWRHGVAELSPSQPSARVGGQALASALASIGGAA